MTLLKSIYQQNWRTHQWPQDWKRSVFIPIPKKGDAKIVQTTAQLHSHASKIMLKILQARLQQYVNHKLPDVQAGFRKAKGTRNLIANICQIIKKARKFQKKHLLLLYWLHWRLWLCRSQQSGSSVFFKSNLYIWKFSVHILLRPSLKNFEHYFASMWDECNCVAVWTFLALPFFGIGMKTDLFQSCGHCWVSQICWHIECSTLTILPFRMWNSSAGKQFH